MNLLPQREIKILKKEKFLRLIIVVCFLISVLECVAILLLLPSYVLVKANRDSLFQSVDQIKHSIDGEGGVTDEMKMLGKDLKDFINNEESNGSKTAELINLSLGLRPKGITTNSISFINDTDGKVMQLVGVGNTREVLIEYLKILNSQDFVKDAHYTEKFIIKKTDINYNLVIILK